MPPPRVPGEGGRGRERERERPTTKPTEPVSTQHAQTREAARQSLNSLSLSFLPGAPRARLVVSVRVAHRTAQLFENFFDVFGNGVARVLRTSLWRGRRAGYVGLSRATLLLPGPSGWPTPLLRDLVVAHPGSTGHGLDQDTRGRGAGSRGDLSSLGLEKCPHSLH